jgi:serine phosphatase RsbU (regulator of sigma subunit)
MPGQLLALLTDGITEAAAPDGVEWGASGVLGYLAANRERPAAELVHGLCAEAMRFAGHHPHKDDMTSVVVKVD